jgi:WD40 repeat protein
VIITGGGDGSIRNWNLQEPGPVHLVLPDSDSQDDNPKIVQLIKENTFVLTNQGNLYAYDSEDNIVSTKTLTCLRNYAVMDANDEIMVLGALDGTIIVVSTSTLDTILEQKVIDGKIFSVSLVDENKMLINGTNGSLILYDLDISQGRKITELSRGVLPESKQRWFAAAMIWVEKSNIIVGDRMGGVHVYNLEDFILLQSFRKLHGVHGVTDIHTSR